MTSSNVDLSQIEQIFKNIGEQAPNVVKGSLQKALQDGVQTSKALAPEQTGKLKKSIHYTIKTVDSQVVSGSINARATNKSGDDYSRFQENGWTDKAGRYHEGKFFMLAGSKEAERKLLQYLVEDLRNLIERDNRGTGTVNITVDVNGVGKSMKDVIDELVKSLGEEEAGLEGLAELLEGLETEGVGLLEGLLLLP